MMIKIATYHDKMSAELIAQALKENQINAIVIGSKEYVSHLFGGDFGAYDLMIDENQVQIARSIINEISVKDTLVDRNWFHL